MENFKIRAYREDTDLQTIYENYCLLMGRTAAHYLSGASPYPALATFSDSIRKERERTYYPFIVADPKHHPIGIAHTSKLGRKCRHHHFSVYLWENAALTEDVLRRVMDMVLNRTANMVVCKIPGYQTEFLAASRNVGMTLVGCITDYVFYKSENGAPDIWPKYTFITKRQSWQPRKKAGIKHDL